MHDLRDDNIDDLVNTFEEIQKQFIVARGDLIAQAEIAYAVRGELGWLQVQIDSVLAESPDWCSRNLWLASLSADVKALIREGSMSKEDAKPLWPLPEKMQNEILARMFREEISLQKDGGLVRVINEMVPDYAEYMERSKAQCLPKRQELIAIAKKFVTTNPAKIALAETKQALPLLQGVLKRLNEQSGVRLASAATNDGELLQLLKMIRQLTPLLQEADIRLSQSWKTRLDERMKSE